MSRTVSEYCEGEVFATDQEMATFFDLAMTFLHTRAISRVCNSGSERTTDKKIAAEMNRVLALLPDHPIPGYSLRLVASPALPRSLRLVPTPVA